MICRSVNVVDRMWSDRKRVISFMCCESLAEYIISACVCVFVCVTREMRWIFFRFMLYHSFCFRSMEKHWSHKKYHTQPQFLYSKQTTFHLFNIYRISVLGVFADRYRSHAYGMNCIHCVISHYTVRTVRRQQTETMVHDQNWIQSKTNSTILTMRETEHQRKNL